MKSSRRAAKAALAAFCFCAAAYAAPGACDTGHASRYVGYQVTRVDIANPLGLVENWLPGFRSLKDGLTLKAKHSFTVEKFNADSKYLNDALRTGFAVSTARVKITFSGGILNDCDDVAKSLRVVYPIFSSVAPAQTQPSVESESRDFRTPVSAAAQQIPGDKMLVTPITGYNQTRAV